MLIEVVELVKYVDNVWYVIKVSFVNEVGCLCKLLEIDSYVVMDIFVQDIKLNLFLYYLKLGFVFGGFCLLKEVWVVIYLVEILNVDVLLINLLILLNDEQVDIVVKMIKEIGVNKVVILGVVFKLGMDDLRESLIFEVIVELQVDGIEVVVYDLVIVLGLYIMQ